MASIMRSRAFRATADELWEVIGDFHALADWHPGVERQTAEGDIRHLDLAGGGVIVERFLGTDGMSYAYEIVSGPLPVEGYRSVLSVAPAGPGSVVVWSSTFEPKVDAAFRLVAGIYEAGLDALAERFPAVG
ncbi:MAG TPA: SRPBCC family protein [Paracoccaceae bacterium]|nr:SRPBCC family protein [Paracoccaceae bacterium]